MTSFFETGYLHVAYQGAHGLVKVDEIRRGKLGIEGTTITAHGVLFRGIKATDS